MGDDEAEGAVATGIAELPAIKNKIIKIILERQDYNIITENLFNCMKIMEVQYLIKNIFKYKKHGNQSD